MLNVHFVRHGFADWVEFSVDRIHVSFYHLRGHLDISEYTTKHVVSRNYAGDVVAEYDQEICSGRGGGRTEYRGDNPLEAISEIERLIVESTGKVVQINRDYVEAYMITNHKPFYAYTAQDVPMYNGVDVRGLTVADLLALKALDWPTYADGSYNRYLERVADLLDTPTVHAMHFIDFYTLIHDNCHKQDFRERVMSALGISA